MTVTRFNDMYSGGGAKTQYEHIYVEAGYDEAIEFFKSWFDRDPHHVTCECCGNDFWIMTHESLEQATANYRRCTYDKEAGRYVEEPKTHIDGTVAERISLDEYLGQQDVGYFSEETVEMELEP